MTRTRVVRIPGGDAGIFRTVQYMRELVHGSLTNPLLIEAATLITEPYCCASQKAQGIRDFLAEKVRFAPDPLGLELLKTPAYMIQSIEAQGWVAGDCDDVATLGAALGMAIGMPARFVLVGFDPIQTYGHVWTDLLTPDGWAELDTTRGDQDIDGLGIVKAHAVEV